MAPVRSRFAAEAEDMFVKLPATKRQRLIDAFDKHDAHISYVDSANLSAGPPLKPRPSHDEVFNHLVQTIRWVHEHFNHPHPFAVAPTAKEYKVHDNMSEQYDWLIHNIQSQQSHLGFLEPTTSARSNVAPLINFRPGSALERIGGCHLALGYAVLPNIPQVLQYPRLGRCEHHKVTADNLMDLRHASQWFQRAEIYMERYAAALRTMWFESSQRWDYITNNIAVGDPPITDIQQPDLEVQVADDIQPVDLELQQSGTRLLLVLLFVLLDLYLGPSVPR